jgi:CubicO group peptidase (beta-lactamase class C family)
VLTGFTTTNAISQPVSDTTLSIVSGAMGAKADSLLTALTASGFSGVALVVKDGRVVLKKGYGLANRATRAAMTGRSVVQIGSNTKDFTITAILQLVERGKLSLSDSIGKFFRDVPADKRGITIDHLLNHRAGFEQHMGPDFDVVTRQQEITRAMAAKLAFEPGTDRKYSNIGYRLLAAIIEMVTGTSYDNYVKKNILDPLGLKNTGLLLPHFDRKLVAHGYKNGADAGTFLERPLAPDGPYWNLRGNGGMLSTVSDMYRFYRVLMSDNPAPLLKAATRDLFFHPEQPSILAGSDLTWFFFYSRFPGAHLDVFLVSNSTDYPAPKAREQLASALGVAPPPGAQLGTIDRAPSTSGKPVALPDSPAGRAAQRFLRANNELSSEVVREFLERDVIKRPEDQRSTEERIDGFKTRGADLGSLTPTRILSSTDDEISFQARAAKQGNVTFTITVEKQAPYRITAIRVEAQ